MNPVPIMKLVEIIRGYDTSDEVTKTIMQLSESLKKAPVEETPVEKTEAKPETKADDKPEDEL